MQFKAIFSKFSGAFIIVALMIVGLFIFEIARVDSRGEPFSNLYFWIYLICYFLPIGLVISAANNISNTKTKRRQK